MAIHGKVGLDILTYHLSHSEAHEAKFLVSLTAVFTKFPITFMLPLQMR